MLVMVMALIITLSPGPLVSSILIPNAESFLGNSTSEPLGAVMNQLMVGSGETFSHTCEGGVTRGDNNLVHGA